MHKSLFFRAILTVSFLIFGMLTAIAQDNTIKGFVYEESSGEPMMFTNVYLKGTTFGGSTNENGFFNINRIPDGNYTLFITSVGYDTISENISLSKGQSVNRKYYLKEASQKLETVTITAEKIEARTETKTSVISVTPKTINRIPSIGGQADFAQYLQVVPGVIFTGDQGGQLYIRGGSPIQNKVLLDGMVIYNPFHSIGLFSVFDTDIIRNADVYTGGFGAEYSGRISSIMDISTRDGNKKRISGKVGASLFGAKVMVEGPLKKAKDPDDYSMSFIVSAKTSYLEQTSQSIYRPFFGAIMRDVDTIVQHNNDTIYKPRYDTILPFNFKDFYGKLSVNAPNGSKVNFFGFYFDDQVNNYQSLADYGWTSYGGGTNFLLIPGKAPIMIEGCVAYSSYKSWMKVPETNDERESYINGFNASFDFSQFIGKNTLKYGFEMLGNTTYYLTYSVYGHQPIGGANSKANSTELGAYVKYKAVLGKFLLEPSLRLQMYSLPDFSFEPRFAAKYNINDRLRLKAAAGKYSQNLVAITSDRDVVNLFYGFLSDIKSLPSTYNGENITHYLQKAYHYILGAEYDLTDKLTMNVEGYWKDFAQLTNINRNKLYSSDASADVPDLLKKDFTMETGDAYGCDLTLKYEDKHWYIWAVYALGFVTREYEKVVENEAVLTSYAPHFDRRHNVNLILTYTAGAKREWEFSGRWNFGSGFPFTPIQGYYEHFSFQDGINFDYTTTNGEMGVLYGELNSSRLPTYHRLDLDIKRKFFFSENVLLEADLSVTNVYNRKNIFYVNMIKGENIYQLPILPTIGLTLSF